MCDPASRYDDFELHMYKTALMQAQVDFFDVNLTTGQAFQSENLIYRMRYEPSALDTFDKWSAIIHQMM